MSPDDFGTGFWTEGKGGTRRRVRIDQCLTAFAAADPALPLAAESFVSAFRYDGSLRTHMESNRGSEAGYAGPTHGRYIWFDLDADDLGVALASARKIVSFLLFQAHGLDDDHVLAFFSGAKGMHLGLPVVWTAEPGPTFHVACGEFARRVAAEVGATIDGSVYTATRLFRAPNTRHGTSGRYKVRLTHDELMHLDPAGVLALAAAPRPFEWPAGPPANAHADALADVWRAAVAEAQAATERRTERINEGRPHHVTRETREVLAGGLAALLDVPEAERGRDPARLSRHHRLVRAAANLAECGVPTDVVHQILTDPGLDARIAPIEVRRSIDNGIALARRGAGGGAI